MRKPPGSDPRTFRTETISISLSPEETERVEALIRRAREEEGENISRSAIIRRALDQAWEGVFAK